jgi:hypothetical protein
VEIQPVGQNWRSEPQCVEQGSGAWAGPIGGADSPRGLAHRGPDTRRTAAPGRRKGVYEGGCDGHAFREIGWPYSE